VERTRPLPFVFDGEVKFTGITLGVKTMEETDALLVRAFGGAPPPARLRRKVGAQVDRGESLPPERRFVIPITYLHLAPRKASPKKPTPPPRAKPARKRATSRTG
jgi:hypothetical protein